MFFLRACDSTNTVGQVKLTVGYSVEESRLFITVHSCRSLGYFKSLPTFFPPTAVYTNTHYVCDHHSPTEPWQRAPRMVQTLTSRSSCYLTRRLPPRGEQPPRRETSTQNSTRGETHRVLPHKSEAMMLTDRSFSLALCRFDFDFSLEESIQRRLDLSVKNSVSFMSRERELIGKVFICYCRKHHINSLMVL